MVQKLYVDTLQFLPYSHELYFYLRSLTGLVLCDVKCIKV